MKAASPASKRISRGSTLEDIHSAVESVTLDKIESPFQVQEYIAQLVTRDPYDVQAIVSLPRLTRTSPVVTNTAQARVHEAKLAAAQSTASSDPPSSTTGASIEEDDGPTETVAVDRSVWIYEQIRRIVLDLSYPWISQLQEHCTRTSCPEMKADSFQFLCAAHATASDACFLRVCSRNSADTKGCQTECCAIDYMTHVADAAFALLNSAKHFPSRLVIPDTSVKQLSALTRRLYRLFAHTFYSHRDLFDSCEMASSLYARFVRLCLDFELIDKDTLKLALGHVHPTKARNTDNEFSRGTTGDAGATRRLIKPQ
ncbi:uncharacterized protein L969DRAFT_52183 [Mixia osmundae IAM 14324]|uniref:uncharacterized protein n=1 Tax=Mixia osmundae (strain CBS 9802 / IAM 14324 / JCM 22182 / KY 12970) TaxID=764103 RepID=UPI0004A55976|nr:uncharacterized protein L969DRAFT_52183 [Mixia osmundae IAM 14324]KEI38109.1 hypothetical protein L969DRAFT_52183 [Mixia osmundae IAM 14324]